MSLLGKIKAPAENLMVTSYCGFNPAWLHWEYVFNLLSFNNNLSSRTTVETRSIETDIAKQTV